MNGRALIEGTFELPAINQAEKRKLIAPGRLKPRIKSDVNSDAG